MLLIDPRPCAIGPVDLDWMPPYWSVCANSTLHIQFDADDNLNKIMHKWRAVYDQTLNSWLIRSGREKEVVEDVRKYVHALQAAHAAMENWNAKLASDIALGNAIASDHQAVIIKLAEQLDDEERAEIDALIGRHLGSIQRDDCETDGATGCGQVLFPPGVDVNDLRISAEAVRRRARARQDGSAPGDAFAKALGNRLALMGRPVPPEILASAVRDAYRLI